MIGEKLNKNYKKNNINTQYLMMELNINLNDFLYIIYVKLILRKTKKIIF